MTDQFDSPWKDALREFFQPFLQLFFPGIEERIDWTTGVSFLDTELRKIAREAETGSREADVLAQVTRCDGSSALLWIHVEVQNQWVQDFSERMLVYHYRIRDLLGGPVCSLGVLGDATPSWRPNLYHSECFGCRLEFEFPVVKLADYRSRLDELESSANPLAVLVAAHLWTQATRTDPGQRVEVKLRLVRKMFRRGFDKGQMTRLFRLVDWMLSLQAPHSLQFKAKLAQYEQEDAMPYISSFEQSGIDKGLAQGRAELLREMRQVALNILANRFDGNQEAIRLALEPIDDLERLRALVIRAATTPSVGEFLTPG